MYLRPPDCDIDPDISKMTTNDSMNRLGAEQVDTPSDLPNERVLSELETAAQSMHAADSRQAVADAVITSANELFGYESVVVRFTGPGSTLEPTRVSDNARFEMGERPIYNLDGDSPAAETFRDSEPRIVEELAAIADEHDRGAAATAMYLPLGEHGVVTITSRWSGAFDQDDLFLASIIVSHATTALDALERERELRHQTARLKHFVDVITHDIPNHLNAASSWVEIVQNTGDVSELDRVQRANDRIDAVIDDMQRLVDSGAAVTEADWVRLRDVIPASWGQCCQWDDAQKMTVVDDVMVLADRSRLEQLLENLFWNACDHGGPDVKVRIGGLENGFYVEDDGPGIPADKREAVIEPGVTTATGEHAGYGLAIVTEIAHAHGWTCDICESEDGGARFEFREVAVRWPDQDSAGQDS